MAEGSREREERLQRVFTQPPGEVSAEEVRQIRARTAAALDALRAAATRSPGALAAGSRRRREPKGFTAG
jgi:hypothetical protein